MKTVRTNSASDLVLTGDIGGTNTGLALVRQLGPQEFEIVARKSFSSQKLDSIATALELALDEFAPLTAEKGLRGACLCGAGPVSRNKCILTNVSWGIDGNELEKRFGFPFLILNDFTAICYGIAAMHKDNPAQLSHLVKANNPEAHADSPIAERVYSVVGAGTGLGIGYLISRDSHFSALPSECGHMDFAAFDDWSSGMQAWARKELGANQGAERFISGQGIENIHQYACTLTKPNSVNQEILALARGERAARISAAADSDETCALVMQKFVQMYARFASSMALVFLPSEGLYLAGGIAAKNKKWFTNDDLFLRSFRFNHQEGMRQILENIDVYIVEDYSISLLGAALGYSALRG